MLPINTGRSAIACWENVGVLSTLTTHITNRVGSSEYVGADQDLVHIEASIIWGC